MNPSPLRADEKFVIEALASSLGGQWRPGENPPDAYLVQPSGEVAVEISTLTQYVPDGKGGRQSRWSQDVPAARLADALQSALRDRVPHGRFVTVVLISPVLKAKKTTDRIVGIIREKLSNPADTKTTESIAENRIEISITSYDGPGDLGCIMPNRNSSPDILANAWYILEDRIVVKAKKCLSLSFKGTVWLALRNDYEMLADSDTYRQALRRITVQHPFAKIFLVSGGGMVTALYERPVLP
jgi:hypothetical protein